MHTVRFAASLCAFLLFVCPAIAQDASRAQVAAESARLPAGTEIPELRDEFSRTFSEGDGRLRTEIHTEPIHRLGPDGNWEPAPTDDQTRAYPDSANYHTGTVYGNLGVPNFYSATLLRFQAGLLDRQYRAWARYNTSGIPDGSDVTAAVCSVFCYDPSYPWYRTMPMTYDPVGSTPAVIYADIADGYRYGQYTTIFSGWNSHNLGDSGAQHIENQLGANWFAVGFWEYELSGTFRATCYGWNAGAYKPKLMVTFIPPVPDVGVSSIDAPDTVPAGTLFDVTVTVHNYGQFVIPEGWYLYLEFFDSLGIRVDRESTLVDSSLVPGAYRQFVFPDMAIDTPCRHSLEGRTAYPGDGNPHNDTLVQPIWSSWLDLEIEPISLYPPPPYAENDILDSIDITVVNDGHHYVIGSAWVHTWLVNPGGDTAFSDSFEVWLLDPGETWRQAMTTNTVLNSPGAWVLTALARLPGDQEPDNNRQDTALQVGLSDAGVVSITAPTGWVDTNQAVIPRAVVRNYGPISMSFTAWFAISDSTDAEVYRNSVTVLSLPSGEDSTVEFPEWPGAALEGTYLTLCSLAVKDLDSSNDWKTGSFSVTARPPWPELWTEVTRVPGTPLIKDGGCLAMNQGNGLIYLAKGNKSKEFWSYDPLGDTYAVLAAIPDGASGKPPKKGCDAISDGMSYVYLTKGNNTFEFWRYHIPTNTWESLPGVPEGPRRKGCKKGTDLSYVTGLDADFVYLLKGYGTEFYRFDVEDQVWEPRTDVPAGARPKVDEGSWLCWDEAATLYFLKAKYGELWPYDLGAATWGTQLPSMPFIHSMVGKKKKAKDGGAGALYDGQVYALKGGNTCEFWKYNPADSWSPMDTMPQVGSTGKKKRVKTGGDIVCFGGGTFFALKGNKTLEMWRYVLPPAAWGSPLTASRSGVMAGPSSGARHSSFAIAPNPLASGYLTLRYSAPIPGRTRVSIYDELGRLVKSATWSLQPEMALDLRSLSAGVYLVRLESRGLEATQKLVIGH